MKDSKEIGGSQHKNLQTGDSAEIPSRQDAAPGPRPAADPRDLDAPTPETASVEDCVSFILRAYSLGVAVKPVRRPKPNRGQVAGQILAWLADIGVSARVAAGRPVLTFHDADIDRDIILDAVKGYRDEIIDLLRRGEEGGAR